MLNDVRVLYRDAHTLADVFHADVAVFSAGPTNLPGDNIFYQPHVYDRSPSSPIPNIFFRSDTKPVMQQYRFVKTTEVNTCGFPMVIERLYACDQTSNMLLICVSYITQQKKMRFICLHNLYQLNRELYSKSRAITGLMNPVYQLIKQFSLQYNMQKGSISSQTAIGQYGILDATCPLIWDSEEIMSGISTTVMWLNLLNGSNNSYAQKFFLQYTTLAQDNHQVLQSDIQSLCDMTMMTNLQNKIKLLGPSVFDQSNPPPLGFEVTNSRVVNCPQRNFGIPKALWQLYATDFQCHMSVNLSSPTPIELCPFFIDFITNRYASHLTWRREEDIKNLKQTCQLICNHWVYPFLERPSSQIKYCTVTVKKTFNDEALVLINTPDPRYNFCIYLDLMGYIIGTYGAALQVNKNVLDATLVI